MTINDFNAWVPIRILLPRPALSLEMTAEARAWHHRYGFAALATLRSAAAGSKSRARAISISFSWFAYLVQRFAVRGVKLVGANSLDVGFSSRRVQRLAGSCRRLGLGGCAGYRDDGAGHRNLYHRASEAVGHYDLLLH